MSNKNEHIETDKNKTTATTSAPSTHEKTKPQRRLSAQALFTITTITLLGTSTYVLVTNQASQHNQQAQNQQLQTVLDTLTQEHQQFSHNLQTSNELLQSKQAALQQQFNALSKRVETTPNNEATQTQSWLLKKAQYYLEVAQMDSQWSHDPATTLVLLQAADTLLQSISDERVINIKNTLTKEITKLQANPTANFSELFSKLDHAQEAILKLHLRPMLAKTPKESAVPLSWHEQLQASLKLLEKLVVIRHYDQEKESKFSPLNQMLLREQLSMDLQKAQWAVLQRNQAIYQQSLTQTNNRLQPYLALKEEGIQQDSQLKLNEFLNQIRHLQQINLSSPKIDLSQSLTELNEIINTP